MCYGGGGSYPSRKRNRKTYPRVGERLSGGDVGRMLSFLHREAIVLITLQVEGLEEVSQGLLSQTISTAS